MDCKIPRLFLLLTFLVRNSYSDCNEDSVWMRSEVLDSKDKKFTIKWNTTEENITMLMIGESKGWIGVGFSPSGRMAGADIVIGWVDKGKPYLKDLYAITSGKPFVDDVQSYELLGGSKNDTHTLICWTRQLNTCDKRDFRITNDTIRVIWAWNDEASKILTDGPQFHGPNKGVRNLHLTGSAFQKDLPKDAEYLDLLVSNYTIPNNTDTVYWCTYFKIPKANRKIHMIGHKPHLQKGSEDLVHHIILYECSYKSIYKLYDNIDSKGVDCTIPDISNISVLCEHVRISWAVGGEGEFYPPDVGFLWGNPERATFFRLEVHYNIFPKHHGIVDNSGVRVFFARNLRKYDAGQLLIGTYHLHLQILPPKQQEFPTVGICSNECTSKTFPPDGIRIFSIIFHTHLTGRKLRLRRYRNGVELEPITDENHDFRYQQPLSVNDLRIMPNDTMVVECFGSTMDRKNATLNGPSSSEEMCLLLLRYYPHVNLSFCTSNIQDDLVYNLTGIEVWKNSATIRTPLEFRNMNASDYLKTYNWTEEKTRALRDLNYLSYQTPYCSEKEAVMKNLSDVRFPYEAKVFTRPQECENF